NFVAGVYYFKGDVSQEISPVLNTGAFKLGQRNMITAETTSLAAFGQATYRVNKQLSLNLGARIGREEAIAGRTATLAPGAVGPLSSLATVSGSTSDTYASYRVGAQYEFTRNNMGYVNYAQGYKGPAVNDNATNPLVPLIVNPEVPKTLEVGLKNLFLDGRLAINVAAWDTKIHDFQAQVYSPSTLGFVFSNAPQATNRGVSMNVYGRPSAALTVNGGVAYIESRYGSGYKLECAVGSPAGCTQDATGAQIGGVPRVKATIAAEYAFKVGDYKAFVGADAVYTSERVLNPQDPIRNIEARTTLGARMGFRSANDNWGVTLYARNLTDEFQPTYRLGNLLGFVAGDSKSYAQFVGPESRRLIGVSLDAKF
ncbi:MAG TPA: TonB-dependent receptor, partial [Burkholderiaceae bacterium]|nr:TonB-dependent receptor [Burkholderiaceae bacterium]